MVKIELKNYFKTIKGKTVLKDITVNFESGKIYKLNGPNGCGKTMLLRAITGLIYPTKGKLKVNDTIVSFGKDYPVKLGVLIETPIFWKEYTGFDVLKYLASIRNEITEEQIKKNMDRVGLDWSDKRAIGKYSLGMRQKLGIASVLVDDIDVLILDEPVSALDPIGRKEVLDLIKSLKNKMTVIFSSHILVDIEKVCDDIILIHNGKILVNDSCDNLLKSSDCLLVKCASREEILLLKDVYNAEFSSKFENTIEVKYQDLYKIQADVLKNAKKLNVIVEKMEVKKENLEEIFLNEVINNG